MIHVDCVHYDGDEDCNKCGLCGYFYTCDGCDDYDNGIKRGGGSDE